MTTSILITTKNRKEELRVALSSAFRQTIQPEVVVVDDGSTDGTAEMVRAEFPKAKLHYFNESKGYIVRRNEGACFASGDIIFSIDDDAEFSTPWLVEQTLNGFANPCVGAVAIPYIEPQKENRLKQKSPDSEGLWITDRFIGTAHAIRRDLFLKLGGYRENLVHQGEEGDFCIRMLDAGYVVRLGNSDSIIHHESPKRSLQRMDYYGCRNSILFVWQNVPMVYCSIHLLATTFNCLRWTFAPSRLVTRLGGICAGYLACFGVVRKPVRVEVYRKYRELAKNGSQHLNQIGGGIGDDKIVSLEDNRQP